MKARSDTTRRTVNRSVAALLGGVMTLAAAAVVPAQTADVRKNGPAAAPQRAKVLPPKAKLHGKTQGEWGALWWQWALSVPADRNPVADPTGEFSAVGQSGPVWFLAGSFGDSVERTCTIPAGKAIFMPVFNTVFGAGVGDCTPPDCDVDQLRANAAAAMETATLLEAFIDGLPVRNLRRHRAASPEPFSVTLPEGAVFGLPSGTFYPHVTDGYWLMLPPLSLGQHEIRLRAVSSLGLDFQVVYHLTVARAPHILPPQSRPYGHSYGEWSALWWRWVNGIPFDQNPVADPSGAWAATGQSGPVWFLAGNFGGVTTREVEVPAGKALFFPIINSVWITTCAGEPRTLEGIRALPYVTPFINAASGLAVELNGVPVTDLGRYRAESPLFCTPLTIYGITTPQELGAAGFCAPGESNPNCADLPRPEEHFGPTDGFGPAMTDGYWLMLPPLKKGRHTLHFAGASGVFALNVTYHLTVK